MKWYQQLYVGDSIKHAKRLKRKIEHNTITWDVFLITFASGDRNLLEILPATMLLQKNYPKDNLHIIGLARGQEEAFEVVRRVVEETYKQTGNVDIWNYLKETRRKNR